MNDRGVKKEPVVIINTYDNDSYELNYTLRDWNSLVDRAEKLGKKKIYLKKYDTNLYFSSIKKEKGRTLHIALPSPSSPKTLLQMWSIEKETLKVSDPDKYYKMEREEKEARKNRDATIKELMEKSIDKRRKRFLTEREQFLNNLAKMEKNFWLITTNSKILDAEKYKKLQIKNKI